MRGNIDYQVARAAAEILRRPVTGHTRVGKLWDKIVERTAAYIGLLPSKSHGRNRATVSSLIRSYDWPRTTSDWRGGHFRATVNPDAGPELYVGTETRIAPGVTVTRLQRVTS